MSEPLATAPYGRAVIALGFLLTAGTGVGLYAAPGRVGRSFAWEIGAPQTASFMGAGYLGAALGLALALAAREWRLARIVLVGALALTTVSLVETFRFLGEFRLDGSGPGLLVAWVWLAVYVALPPAVLAVLVWHERRAGVLADPVDAPLGAGRRAFLAALALAGAVLGLWLSAAPAGLAGSWPWKLGPLPAAIVGTWLLTVAAIAAWAIVERDRLRVRRVAGPFALTAALDLVALVRLRSSLTGSDLAVAVYALALAVTLAGLALVAVRVRTPASQAVAVG